MGPGPTGYYERASEDVAVACVSALAEPAVSTRKAVEQWRKPLVYYKTSLFWGSQSLVFNFCPSRGLVSATGVKRTPTHRVALALAAKTVEAMRLGTTGHWEHCEDLRRSPHKWTALAVAAKVRNIMEVRHVLAHPSDEITQKVVATMIIATTGQLGLCEACLQMEAKRHAMQWIDGTDKTGSDGVDDEDLGVKPGIDDTVGK